MEKGKIENEQPPSYGDLASAPTMLPPQQMPQPMPQQMPQQMPQVMPQGMMQPMPQGMPPQQTIFPMQQQPVYIQAPAPNYLGGMPTMVTCPSCHAHQQSVVRYDPNTKTHLMALLICILGMFSGICCCCIPYCMDSCQSAVHHCRNCGAYIGTYQN
ncbi:lipopolysaccharide-induced tumor necrosis factor-alpha factor homolog isoform X1 [Drosophila nasuta]|uniref:lipopolysaccharide-induced tumor necrosis factor-alpha factor homolog isoform X1 n=1 Tax=Drosophila nasuta TaxID=42062 RepID=UPI00295F288A|nr:lipopolysaccharide-induced tumor necrosis factor-alpha factor homolog isoform X1 [Drosophila nasuta]